MSDPYYANVSLLLPLSGSNGSTTFTDYSPSPKTVTRNGNVQISNAQTLFGENTAYFDGAGDYLEVSNSSAFNFNAGPFTLEFFFYSAARVNRIFGNRGNSTGWLIVVTPGTLCSWNQWGNSGYSSVTGASPPINQFNHIAICRDSNNNVTVFIGGTAGTPQTLEMPLPSNVNMCIGYDRFLPDTVNTQGFIGPVRITNVCRYTENFTPPIAPFPTSGGTTLVLNNSTQAAAAASATLTQAHTLALQSATHTHTATALTLTQAYSLALQIATHTQISAALDLTQAHLLAVQYAAHLQSATVIELNQGSGLTIAGGSHLHAATGIVLTQSHLLAVQYAVQSQLSGLVDLSQQLTLIISPALHAQLAKQAQFFIPLPIETALLVQADNRLLIVSADDRILYVH